MAKKVEASDIIIKQVGASEPMEMQIGQDGTRTLKSSGDSKEALSASVIEPVDRPLEAVDQEKLAMMKFMEDIVEVHIHSVTDKAAEQIFEIIINGESQLFRRNERKKVKRKFADRLARLKVTTYGNREVYNREMGERQVEYPASTALRYPFSVTHDPHPRGAEWLRAVLSEA